MVCHAKRLYYFLDLMKSFVCLVQTPTTIWNETYGICRIRMQYSRVKSEKKFISKFGLKTSTTEHLLTSIMVTFGKIMIIENHSNSGHSNSKVTAQKNPGIKVGHLVLELFQKFSIPYRNDNQWRRTRWRHWCHGTTCFLVSKSKKVLSLEKS